MRVVAIFFVYLCSFLLWGAHHTVEDIHQNGIQYSCAQNSAKTQEAKYTDTNQDYTIIEDADLDLGEENHISDDIAGKSFAGKYSLPDMWYSTLPHLSILNYYYKGPKTLLPFCGNSYPIYITQRVLRI